MGITPHHHYTPPQISSLHITRFHNYTHFSNILREHFHKNQQSQPGNWDSLYYPERLKKLLEFLRSPHCVRITKTLTSRIHSADHLICVLPRSTSARLRKFPGHFLLTDNNPIVK